MLINVTTEDNKSEIVIDDLEPNNLYKTRFAAFNEEGDEHECYVILLYGILDTYPKKKVRVRIEVNVHSGKCPKSVYKHTSIYNCTELDLHGTASPFVLSDFHIKDWLFCSKLLTKLR